MDLEDRLSLLIATAHEQLPALHAIAVARIDGSIGYHDLVGIADRVRARVVDADLTDEARVAAHAVMAVLFDGLLLCS